ncbi:hypothetical protein DYB32_000376 [Aphanomyces invadans]|uniref:Uncharacterized protein n=1 Tax=Aphanomyces invadans TaxID=157072 RepID=A0A418BA84_9STRA|nr:hypothetical protein DYB32_000376 [Aphanomyces invadans]
MSVVQQIIFFETSNHVLQLVTSHAFAAELFVPSVIVLATLGFYTVLTAPLWFPTGKKAKVEEPAASSAADVNASTEIPSLFDDNFDEWSKVPGNFAKWEKSLDTVGN